MSRRVRTGLVLSAVGLVVVALGQVLLPGQRARRAPNPAAPAPASPPPPSQAPPAPVSADAEARPPGARVMVAGIPMGYSHDEAGARAAAAGFARAYGDLVAFDDAGAEAAQRAMATRQAAGALVADMRTKLAAIRQRWGVGELTYQVAPLAVRVRMNGGDAANADVWYVGVVAGRGLPTYEEWVTESYRLAWEGEDWHIAADAQAQGPRPDPGQQSAASQPELASRLAGFEAVS